MVAVPEEDDARLKLKSEAAPLRGTVSGLVKELSVMVSEPFLAPDAVGENVIWRVHVPAGAMADVQLLV